MNVTGRADGPLLLGIDGGTEGARAALFTADGREVAFARAPYPTEFPHPGWAQADPRHWWAAVVQAVREVIGAHDIDPKAVAGISYACTSSTVVFCDPDGEPTRPALIWMDVRSSAQARQIVATEHPALKYSGYTNLSAEWLPCKTLWVAQNDPEAYGRSSVVCEYTDWLGFRLTGRWAASINSAAIRSFHDRDAGGWPATLFEQIGLDDLIDRLPPEVLDMGTVQGGLAAHVASELGLEPGTPVAVGGADAFVAMVGLDVVRPGRVALITGSSHLQLAQTATPTYGSGLFGAYTDAVVPGQYTLEGGQPSTGSILRWFRDLVTGFAGEGLDLRATYQHLNAEAAKLPPGSDGVQVLEHWQGSRTPHTDSDSRGVIWGLALSHGAPHLFRAIIESICFGTEVVFRTMTDNGHAVDEVIACGGALNSELWVQIHADVSNRTIAIPEVTEAAALGSAILAAVGAGLHADVHAATASMVRVARHVEPQADAHEAYGRHMDGYREAYGALRDLNHRLTRHEAAVR